MRFQAAYSTPPVVKNLIILNALFFLAEMVLPAGAGDWMIRHLGLFYWGSGNFQPLQLVTHMFMHASLTHLFFNMFALWMFGRTLEYELGSKRFLLYYMVTGVGAGLLQLGVTWIEVRLACRWRGLRHGQSLCASVSHPCRDDRGVGSRFRRTAGLRHDASQLDDHAADSAHSDQGEVFRDRLRLARVCISACRAAKAAWPISLMSAECFGDGCCFVIGRKQVRFTIDATGRRRSAPTHRCLSGCRKQDAGRKPPANERSYESHESTR